MERSPPSTLAANAGLEGACDGFVGRNHSRRIKFGYDCEGENGLAGGGVRFDALNGLPCSWKAARRTYVNRHRDQCQPACKPGSVREAESARVATIPLGRSLRSASSNPPGRLSRRGWMTKAIRAVPIRSCSRRGLPCRLRYRRRGGLLPHRFTLTPPTLRSWSRPWSPMGLDRTAGGAVCFLWRYP